MARNVDATPLTGVADCPFLVQIQQNSLRVKDGGSCHHGWCAKINEDTECYEKLLREIATTMMNLFVFLRFLLGQLSRIRAPLPRLPAIGKVAGQPYSMRRAVRKGTAPHEWISMVYVLTEGSPMAKYTLRGAFERPTHPLGSILRFARRLAGVPKPYPALAATVCLANRQSGAIDP